MTGIMHMKDIGDLLLLMKEVKYFLNITKIFAIKVEVPAVHTVNAIEEMKLSKEMYNQL